VAAAHGQTLVDFSAADEIRRWEAVHDRVMGGVSDGGLDPADGGVRFHGSLRLEHGGGFASVRRALDAGLPQDCAALAIRLRGDGRRYQLRLRHARHPRAIAWRAEFDAPSDWRTLRLPLTAFAPVFRGRPVPDAGPLQPAAVRELGLMIADRRAGAFALDVAAIRALSS
jgi:monofunctional biosynthetic peptidoglycan transglycosylase